MFGVEHPHLKNKKRNNEFAWIKGNYAYLPIRRLETVDYDGEVHNIAVENNNTYVTAGAIVHNCDGAFFKNKEVIVIGGGDSAMEESLFLTKFASKITIIHRRDSFRASKIMQERVFKHEKIKVLWNKEIIDVLGNGKIVTGVKLKDIVTGKTTDFSCHGVFLAIGHVPNTSFLHGMLEMDELGYLKADAWTHTKVPGIFAAGDVQDRRFRQAITAAGSGCMAAMEAEKYLAGME
ncbi:FAD-dependent oxidoreductase [Candidatus Woesearchaeota archaeon]|nr:FAD-dependent oxidoreductase [Candidatus Woesearchaeota archaeon]